MNRTFNTQTTLILLMFLFYLWQILVSRKFKPVVFCITILFVLGLSFLHFFRYPWSRSREFRAVLKLERSGGILVRPSEKSLYEGLSAYLSQNLNKDDKIVVLGYDPQFIFLTGYQSLFPDQEYIFLKLELLMKLCPRDPKMLVRLHSVESKIIFRIQSQKPKVILDIVSEKKEGLFKGAVAKYIRDNYTLRRTFGPGQIYDMKSAKTGWARVDLYALR